MADDLLRELRDYVRLTSGGCWEWTRSKTIHGYGKIKRDGQNIGAHRYVWSLANNSINQALQLDHLCRNRACVNPDHLEPVTASENIRRGRAAKGSYDDCPIHGPKTVDSRGVVTCRGCRANAQRLRRVRLIGKPPPKHGLRSSYATYGCRCSECVAAQHDYATTRRVARAVLREEAGNDARH